MIGAPAATAEPTGAGWKVLVVTSFLKVVGLGAGLYKLTAQVGLTGVPAAVVIVAITLAVTFRPEIAAAVTSSGTGGQGQVETGAGERGTAERHTEAVGTETE